MIGREIEQTNPLRGLTIKQIDQSLYEVSTMWNFKYRPYTVDFWSEASVYAHSRKLDISFPNIFIQNRSKKLERFLKINRPQMLFFDPAEIAERLNPNSNVLFKYKKTKEYERWKFYLNPQKFPLKEDEIKNDMLFTKPLVDINSKRVKFHTDPYFVVKFPATYKDGLVTFSPEIEITYGSMWPNPEEDLHRQILGLLNVPEKQIAQKLDFRSQSKVEELPDGETRNKYTVTICLAKT
jgi:hypothetical protein